MTELKCGSCGTEILPGTNFCRRCGVAFTAGLETDSSELPTALLHAVNDPITQRLDPRPTSGDRVPVNFSAPANQDVQEHASKSNGQRKIIFGVIVLVFVIAAALAFALVIRKNRRTVVRMIEHSGSESAAKILYPGGQVMVDLTGSDGTRTVHLQTSDPLDRVENWYQSNLRLDKTFRLTEQSVVMKSDKIVITLISDEAKTIILIKQSR